MAAMKKRGTTGATSEDTATTTTTTPSQGEVAATQANGTSSDGVSVDALADGQFEVNLLDLGVSAEEIAAMLVSTLASKWREGLSNRLWKQNLQSHR